MNDSLNFIYYAFSKFLTFIFNDFIITNYATFGWIVVSSFAMGITIKSLLNIVNGVKFGHQYFSSSSKSNNSEGS